MASPTPQVHRLAQLHNTIHPLAPQLYGIWKKLPPKAVIDVRGARHSRDYTPVQFATLIGNIRAIEWLVSQELNINAGDHCNGNALSQAAGSTYHRRERTFLKKWRLLTTSQPAEIDRVDVNARDYRGHTPIFLDDHQLRQTGGIVQPVLQLCQRSHCAQRLHSDVWLSKTTSRLLKHEGTTSCPYIQDGREQGDVQESATTNGKPSQDRSLDLIFPIPEALLSPSLEGRAYDSYLDYIESQTLEHAIFVLWQPMYGKPRRRPGSARRLDDASAYSNLLLCLRVQLSSTPVGRRPYQWCR